MRFSQIPYRIVRHTAYYVITFLFILSQFIGALSPAFTTAYAASAPSQPASSIEQSPNLPTAQSPIALSRVQTSYLAGQTVVEFTLTNNLPTTRLPDIPTSTPVTDTIGLLADFSLTDDANTLHALTVVDTLAGGVTLLDASGTPAVSGNTLTWTLPDLPPQSTATISMTLQTPAQTSGFVNLDTGAQANAAQWGNAVSTTAAPAVLIPTGLDAAYTQPTVDADSHDTDMLWKSTEFGQDALAMFEYVRGFAFDAYKGSLRGTRGTLWGEAGNSVDQSSALIAMLRAAGIPARYRHGTLNTADAQMLIASMFPAAPGLAGTLPAGTPVSDPVNDPDLLALVSDHWWVEAYLPGSGWTDLDPSFTSAQPGDVFATPGANDRLAEVPDAIRHHITIRLRVERYNSFPNAGVYLSDIYPLNETLATAELASKRLILGHFVNTELQGGIITNVIHTFTPYLGTQENNAAWLGDSFQDLLTNFPLASNFTTGEWLEYDLEDPDGNTESFTRTVKDLIGPAARVLGGGLNLGIDESSPPFATQDDLYVNWVIPNRVGPWAYQHAAGGGLAQVINFATHSQGLLDLIAEVGPDAELTPEQQEQVQAARTQVNFSTRDLLTGIGLDYAWDSDQTLAQIEHGLQTKLYYTTPRVFTVASVGNPSDVLTTTVDLRRTSVETLVYPGQAQSAALSAQWAKGLAEAELEGQALERVYGTPAVTTALVFNEMEAQGITPVYITPAQAYLIDVYPFTPDVKAYVTQALIAGKNVLIPSEPVDVDGVPTFAWWEFDPTTGETISVGDNGLHSALEFVILEEILLALSEDVGVPSPNDVITWFTAIGEALKKRFEEIAAAVAAAAGGGPGGLAPETVNAWRYFPAYLCPVENCGVEQFFSDSASLAPIPLPEMTFAYPGAGTPHPVAFAPLAVTGSGGGSPAFSVVADPATSNAAPNQLVNFQVSITSNFSGDFNTAIYAPAGWNVTLAPNGDVTALPAPGAASGTYTIQLVAQAEDHRELVHTAQHTVTVSSLDTVSVSLDSEPDLTVPMGIAQTDAVSNQTNDGEAEIGGAAYTIHVANPGQTAHTYNVTVSGPPAGWVWLNGAQTTSATVSLSAGETAHVGLYLQDPSGNVPAPGTSFPVNVTAMSGSLSDSDSGTFTVPGQAFNYITAQPTTLYLGSDSSTDFSIQMTNVGNTAGNFPLSIVSTPLTATVTGLPASVSLAVDETQTLNATLNTSNIPLGSKFPIILGSPAPGSYTQYAVLTAQIVSPISEPVFIASDNAANACTLGEPGLSAALDSLALAMVHLEASCTDGTCDLSLRDQTVNAAYTAALYAGGISTGITQDAAIIAAADDLASHTDSADIMADLQNLSDAVVALDSEVCAWSESKPDLTWTPYYNAALVSQPATYTLGLTNEGTLTTTYNLTVTLPSGTQTFNPTINPGDTSSYEFPVSSPTIGLLGLSATATVADHPTISDSADAVLNTVDKFVQLTAVIPNPPFVETGVSSTDISISVANNANILQPATAHLEILHPSGAVQFADEYPVTILIGSPRAYALGSVDTSGWDSGVYTITVELRNPSGALIPDGAGYGYLGVGQSVGISHTVEPVIVAPGAVTVTTVITTEILTPGIITPTVGDGNQENGNGNQEKGISPSQFPLPSSPFLLPSSSPITRTEDTDPAFVYAGVWTVVTIGGLNVRASHNDYTWADANGETATLSFNGMWLHLGFVTDSGSGQAEIFVDGVSQGVVDLYSHDPNVVSYVYDGFTNAAHTLQIFVLGTHHPNASNNRVQLDYVDTWDGTLYGDGLVEQDSPRVWHNNNWNTVADANASGGTFMTDDGNNAGSAWFPFTGDSITFMALANGNGFRTGVYIDGAWQGNFWLYNGTSITRTLSFDGLGAGPHVMRITDYYGEPNVDAFVTPALEPGYVPPTYTGIVRYEEDSPEILYNGYPFELRPSSWYRDTATQPTTSDVGLVGTTALNNTIEFTFDGRWVNVGFIARSNNGLAEVFIDGVSQGVVDTYASGGGSPMEVQYSDLITGTHTISITVLNQFNPPSTGSNVRFDYFDVWDGTPMSDDFVNVHKGDGPGRVSYNKSGQDATHASAINGDYFSSGLSNSLAGVWYHFTGDAFSLYGLTRNNTTNVKVYVDGAFLTTADFFYPYSEQPFVYHYAGFGEGPHTVRIDNGSTMRLDGFASNPASTASYSPVVEWYESDRTAGASIWGGLHVPPTVGDINGDGKPEIVIASSNIDSNGELFVLNGDGSDAGGGTPILWSHPYNIFNGFEDVGAPAIAELDGQPGAEIIHATANGMYVYHSDGSLYWSNPSYVSFAFFSSPAVGNLDLDPEPEIVINLSNKLVVFEPDGTVAWEQLFPTTVSSPVLADLNGDGLLDILVYASGQTTLFAYNYNYGSPVLLWNQTLPSALSVYGTPAVANIDGQQPGGDPGPEVAVSTNGNLSVLNGEDGSFVWTTPLDPGDSSSVSIADVDGDGEVEMIAGINYNGGMVYAVNADGSILWDVPALDNSPVNPSLFDLNGDGVYEITFNGASQGLTIYNGPDGATLFNEPNLGVRSQTGSDFPIFADVDNDGYGELVVPAQGGLRVFGWDEVWGPSRPLWNELTYHITNVNDDFSIPISEPNSWEVHNTFRTQTVLVNPMPSYAIALTHTIGLDSVTVLTDTFNIPPTASNDPAYNWDYAVTWENTIVTQTFVSLLTNLQPGESRMVAQGTTADYVAPGGTNHLELPPLFVSVAHIVDLLPASQTVGSGGTTTFNVALTNPGSVNALYTLDVNGLPAGWAILASAVPVSAGDTLTVSLTVDVPLDADAATLPFLVSVSTDQGAADQVGGWLNVAGPLVQLDITPEVQTITTGEVATYTLAITNLDSLARTYNLSSEGLASVTLPAQVTVNGNSTAYVSLSAQAVSEGANPFSVLAVEATGFAAGQDTASVIGEGFQQVEVTVIPSSAPSGPGVLTPFDVRITNLGTIVDTYNLTVSAPAGWETALTLFGTPISTVDVAPGTGNALTLQLFLTPVDDTTPGDYDFSVTAQSLVSATGAGVAQVGNLGVSVALSGPAQMSGSGTWDVTVTNNGATGDTYDLTAFGPFAPYAQFSVASVSLAPGASQTVQLTVSGISWLATDYLLGVHAQSQTESYVQDQDTLIVSLLAVEGVSVALQPDVQTVNGTTQASFTLVITNTGNTETTFTLSASVPAGVTIQFPVTSLPLPAFGTATMLIGVTAPGNGTFHFTVTATGTNVQDSDTATLAVEGVESSTFLYLPLVYR
ncbi:MAG: hypothetical protein H6636_05935 [Anaerolineales bacterium]|nr:hypothetical protein [Anaerolineales bacterium]